MALEMLAEGLYQRKLARGLGIKGTWELQMLTSKPNKKVDMTDTSASFVAACDKGRPIVSRREKNLTDRGTQDRNPKN